MTLPIMEPPPSLDFIAMDRIRELYSDMPTVFAEEIARRQQHAPTPFMPPPTPSAGTPNLKRDRPDESIDTGMSNKRRDMGDTKMLPPSTPSTSHPHPSSSTPHPIHPNPTNNNLPFPGTPQSPPTLASITPAPGSAEASAAASSRDRARQLQIQQAMQQQQQQQQRRQMSPGQGGMQNAVAGPSNL
ncbi:hypothetical protein PLICRDRAFT_34993 [Plicaturopsis crispa FD-325 SS-3]|nr:hypothetical protein PLICRDRAFT_34993 [Plicaturopsis crispa FD-325 SS-3]